MSRKITIEDIQRNAEDRGGKCLSTVYINSQTKLKFQCKEGHIWEAIPNSIRLGRWCRQCFEIKLIGRKLTPEHIQKIKEISVFQLGHKIGLGRKCSEESIQKMIKTKKEMYVSGELVSWNKGKHLSKETKQKLSINHKGNHLSPKTEFGEGHIPWNKGIIWYERQGEKNSNWKGGIARDRDTGKYRRWRSNIFKRDNWICQKCGRVGYIEAHHIKNWAEYPELRFEISNGITLCKNCHYISHGWHV